MIWTPTLTVIIVTNSIEIGEHPVELSAQRTVGDG